jgi:hypothetical protein
MPNATGIDEFNYNPEANHFEVASEGGEAKEASTKDVEATRKTPY